MPDKKYFETHEEYLDYYKKYRKDNRKKIREYNTKYMRIYREKHKKLASDAIFQRLT